MIRRLLALASICVAASLSACGQAAPGSGTLGSDVAREQAAGSARLTAPLALPAVPGTGLAVKAVCAGNTGAAGSCGAAINTVAAAITALNAPAPGATPPTVSQVLSFVPSTPVGWGDHAYVSGASTGLAFPSSDGYFDSWFGANVTQVPVSFAGYLAIPASAVPVTKSFAVGSDDGFTLAISNGSQLYKYTNDGPRSFATGGTPSSPTNPQPPNQPCLQVTFPAGPAALYPLELVFYESGGVEAVELSWADGAVNNVPAPGNLRGYSLIPATSLYAPNISAALWAQNTDAAAGNIARGTHLTYTAKLVNSGAVAASNLTFTVVLPASLTYPVQTNPAGCTNSTTGGVTTFACTGINLAAGATQTISFNATVANNVAANANLDVQGVVQGLATSTDFGASGAGILTDTAQIYVYTDDPGATASALITADTGNAPSAFLATVGPLDDDATRATVGQPLPQPPVITAPVASVSALALVTASGTSGFAAGQQVLVTFTGPVTKTCTATVVAGGTWSCPGVALPDGSYSAVAAVVNAAGVSGQPSAAFPITVTAPATPVLTSPANGAVVRASPEFFSGTDAMPAGTQIVVTVTDSSNATHLCTAVVQSDHSWVCVQTLADGGYSWTAAVAELAGTNGPAAASQTFTINTGGLPAPTMAQTASPTGQGKPTLSGTASGSDTGPGFKLVVYDGSTPICTLNPATTAWTCPALATALADGPHVLTAVIFDNSGNSSPASNADAFVVDTTAPAAPTVAQATTPTSQSKPVISGTGEPGASVAVTDSHGNAICSATVQSNGAWSCAPSTALADGAYTVSAKQTDAAGNASAASSTMTFTVDTRAPGAPTISQPLSPTHANTPVLSGSADPGTVVVVRDQAGTILCQSAVVPAGGNWSCTSAALPDGTDVLTATATDAAGNSTASAPVTVVVDTIAPAAPVLAQTGTPTANTLPTFAGTAESGTTVSVSIGGAVVCTAPVVNGAFSCTSKIALPGNPQSYTATATAKDAAGNVSAASNSDTFLVDTRTPGAPTLSPLPTPPGGQPNTTSETQPTFSGTGTPGDMVSVETQPGGATLCSAVVAANGTWQCTTQANEALNGNPPTQVAVAAVQETPAGVTGPASTPISFTVATATPGTPTIAALPATLGTETPALSGTADAGTTLTVRDESGRVICVVEPVPAGGSWSCTPQVPLHEGMNSLTAVAVGPSGLTSAPSNTVTTNVDTLAPLPPTLGQTASPTANTLPTFVGTAEPGSTVNIYDGSSTTPVATCTAASDGSFSCATNAATPLTGAPSTHSVLATATDAAGNVSAPSNVDPFVVDTSKPVAPVLSPLPTSPGAMPGFSSNTEPTFSGTGTPGDTVTVQSTSPSTQALCTAKVRPDGSWSCTSTVPLTGSPATGYTFTAAQTSPAGVPSDPSAPQQETISTDAPAAPTLDVPATPSASTTVPLSGTGTAGDTVAVLDPTGQVLCTATVQSDGSWSCNATPLPDGTTPVTAVDVSSSGVPSAPSTPGQVVVITVGPLAPTLAQTASPTNNAKPTFTGKAQPDSTVTVSEGSQVLCTTTAAADGTYSCQSGVQLADGLHNVTATATDAAGNVSPASSVDQFTVDTSTPPAPVIAQQPAENGGQPGVTANPYPVFTGTGVPGDTVTVTGDGQTLCTALVHADGSWSCTSAVSLPGNPATTYPLSATQTSPAGNTSPPGTQTITIDSTATAIPTLDQPASPTRNTEPRFTGTGVPGDTVDVYAGAALLCSAVVATDGSWACAPTAPLADGSYVLVAQQLGPQGTASGSSAPRSLIVETAAVPGPTFDQPFSPTEQNEPTLSGSAEPGATVTVTDVATGAVICTAQASNAGAWSCQPTTPLSLGAHTLVATASDAAGNVSPPSPQRTVVVNSPDGLPHVAITAPGDAAELTNPRPAITGTSTPGTVVSVTVDGTVYQAQTAADGAWTLTLSSDLAAGMHTVSAVASDAGGNASAPASVTFQVFANYLARGGCTSGGVPSPVLALLALLLLLRLRRSRTPRTAEAASAARSELLRPVTAAALAMVAIATIPLAARAQANFNLETFRPAAGGDGFAGVEGARPPIEEDKDNLVEARLWLSGTNRPLTTIEQDGSNHALVRQRYDGWLAAQFHLNGPLSLSAQIPFLLAQHGDLSFLPPAARGPSSFGASIGDVRITPRVSLLRQESVGVDLAVQGSLELPTGSTDSLSSDDRVNGEFLAALGHRFYLSPEESLELIGNVYTRLRPPREILDVKVGSTVGIRAGLAYYLAAQAPYIPHRVYGELDGQSYVRAGFTSGSAPAEWRVGGTWCVGWNIALDAAVGTGIGNGVGAPAARGLLGLGYSPAACRPADRDGDGVIDREDKCIDVPGVPERQGCPPLADRDHDGVPDAEDACPDEPGIKENRGCPASHDRDGDGTPDLLDRCPDLPGPASNKGCPEEQKPPVCPTPEPAKAVELALPLAPLVEAAPPPPDRDHDGVPDAQDNCPDEPGPVENHGCPAAVKQLVVISGSKIDILDKVFFATNKSLIDPRSFPLLDQVAQVLNAHPELLHIEVQGHTDNVGDPKKNRKLSQARAEAVVAYLVKAKVEAARLSAKGYGSEQPVTPNTSKAAREKNRRVEFHVTEVKPHTIEAVQPAKN